MKGKIGVEVRLGQRGLEVHSVWGLPFFIVVFVVFLMRIDAPVFVPTTSTTAANSTRSVRRRLGCEMPRQTISILNPDAEPFVPSGRCWLAPPTGEHR